MIVKIQEQFNKLMRDSGASPVKCYYKDADQLQRLKLVNKRRKCKIVYVYKPEMFIFMKRILRARGLVIA